MKKIILAITIIIGVFFIIDYQIDLSYAVDKKEATKIGNNIGLSVQKYFKEHNSYPENLTKIKDFPYKIYMYKNKYSEFLVTEERKFAIEKVLISKEAYLIQVDFPKSRLGGYLTGMTIFFDKTGDFKLIFYGMPGLNA